MAIIITFIVTLVVTYREIQVASLYSICRVKHKHMLRVPVMLLKHRIINKCGYFYFILIRYDSDDKI
jgi:hypothetical protein